MKNISSEINRQQGQSYNCQLLQSRDQKLMLFHGSAHVRLSAAFLFLVLVMTLVQFVFSPVLAVDLPAKAQAKLLLKTLTMESGEKAGGADTYTIVVLDRAEPGSFSAELVREMQNAGVSDINGKPLKVIAGVTADFQKALDQGARTLVLCDLDGQNLESIATAAEKAGAVTVGIEPDWIRGGLILGIFLEEARPKIHFNITASNKAGLVFKNQLLKISNIIK